MIQLPEIALSVRQPWAWAIAAGHKDVENRSTFAVSKAGFDARRVAIHAAKGMTIDEYEDAADFMARLGIKVPRPDALLRGAILGAATVTAVVAESDSPWFFGPRGLMLRDAIQVEPIPAAGALGYFEWATAGQVAAPLPWMLAWPDKHQPRRRQPEEKPTAPLPLFGRSA
ncbi:MAG: hypothetical protein HYU60_00355 [Magnetospirillum sp.]|nr:hypothetical protein [Magnetospirillum sp.]